MKTPIGIDLGTTNCCLACMDKDGVRVLEIDERDTMPSVIAQEEDGELLIGIRARECVNPLYRYGFIKRYLGLNVQFPFLEVPMTPVEISTRFLEKIKQHAEQELGEVAAVITVPAHFEEIHLRQTRDAALLAGLEVLNIVREPIAAAIAYHHEEGLGAGDDENRILVYDLGGGTMDATLCIRQGDHILVGAGGTAYDGNKFLGGLDFDKKLVCLVEDRLVRQGVDRDALVRDLEGGLEGSGNSHSPLIFRAYMQKLLSKAERVKIELSEQDKAQWLQELSVGVSEVRIKEWISRTEYETRIDHLLEDTLQICDHALIKQGRTRPGVAKKTDSTILTEEAGRLDAVILVGGSTRTPAVMRKLTTHFNELGCNPPIEVFREDECVAMGAAHIAGQLLSRQRENVSTSGKVRLTWDVPPPTRVPVEKNRLQGLAGQVEEMLPAGGSLQLDVNNTGGGDLIAVDGGHFILPPVSLAEGENHIVLTLLDTQMVELDAWNFHVLRGGVSADTGGLARPVYVRLLDDRTIILPAGTKPKAAHRNIFYTQDDSGSVRLPLYEGYHAIGNLEFSVEAPSGTPIEVRATYLPGAIEVSIHIDGIEEQVDSLNLQPHDIQAEHYQLEERFHHLRQEIDSAFEGLATDAEAVVLHRKLWDSLQIDLRAEFEGRLVPDMAKIDDRLQQAETLGWQLKLLENSVESLGIRVANLHDRISGADLQDNDILAKQLSVIEQKILGSGDQMTLRVAGEELNELERRLQHRMRLEITEQHVTEMMLDINTRLEKIGQMSDPGSEAYILVQRIGEQAEKIFRDTDKSPKYRINRLWGLDDAFLRQRYQDIVMAGDRVGLLCAMAMG